jgi:hypothetical protein
MVIVVGRQCHPAGAPAQSASLKQTSAHAFARVSHVLLLHSLSLAHAAPTGLLPAAPVGGTQKMPTSFVCICVDSETSAQTSPPVHSLVLRQGARQRDAQKAHVAMQTALRQSLGLRHPSLPLPPPAPLVHANV